MWTNKKGISPIVGVILVVAMTVLLAAIAWTYMGGMVSSPGKVYMVQPIVKKEGYERVVVMISGKDVGEISKVDFSGSVNKDGEAFKWILYNGTNLIFWNKSISDVDTNLTYANIGTAIGDVDKTTVFVFGNATYGSPDSGITVGVKEECKSYYKFIGVNATRETNSNTIVITITFKDGTTQTFEQKI